jgi:hypothetical protein
MRPELPLDEVPPPLADVALGDVIVVPDGRSLTVRAKVPLPIPVGSMAGFVICGDMEMLLSTPSFNDAPVTVYQPLGHLPPAARNGRSVCEGAAAYWAPHLPAIGGAMGEILWRVVEVRGSVDPIVIVYRGNEVTVFVRTGEVWGSQLEVLYMRRDIDNDLTVARHSSVVIPARLPIPSEVPDEIEAPVRVPVPVEAPERHTTQP